MIEPNLPDGDRLDRIAQLWCDLAAAAAAGDERARGFLEMFGP